MARRTQECFKVVRAPKALRDLVGLVLRGRLHVGESMEANQPMIRLHVAGSRTVVLPYASLREAKCPPISKWRTGM